MSYRWKYEFDFVVFGIPKAQPRARSSSRRKGVHNPKTADDWKRRVQRAVASEIPAQPYSEPLKIDIDLYFKRPKRLSDATRQAYGGKVPDCEVVYTAKPDKDNAEKAILDALERAGLMKNDSVVCAGEVRKFYHEKGGEPRAEIFVYKFEHLGESNE